MKTFFLKPLKTAGQIALFGAILWACQESEPEFANFEQTAKQSSTTAKDNNEIIAATQGALEITAGIFEDEGISNGRAETSARVEHGDHKDRDGCKPIVSGSFEKDKTHPDTIIYFGTFIIDYGDGSSCDASNIKQGRIIDNFKFVIAGHGHSRTFSSVEFINFERFVKNGVRLDGKFKVHGTRGQFNVIKTIRAKLNYSDGSSTLWAGSVIFKYDNGESSNWKDNTVRVTGKNYGTNRDGYSFKWDISEEVVFRYDCHIDHKFYPVSGIIKVQVASARSVVSFGDGTCDTIYTIKANGETREFDFESDD